MQHTQFFQASCTNSVLNSTINFNAPFSHSPVNGIAITNPEVGGKSGNCSRGVSTINTGVNLSASHPLLCGIARFSSHCVIAGSFLSSSHPPLCGITNSSSHGVSAGLSSHCSSHTAYPLAPPQTAPLRTASLMALSHISYLLAPLHTQSEP